MKNVHLKTWETIDKKTLLYAKKANMHKKEMLFEPGDLGWIHLRKDRFPTERSSKLKLRGDGPFKVLEKVNDSAYEIDLPSNKYALSSTFKVGQVTSNTPKGPNDGQVTSNTPKGPTTRARARQLNNEVKSLLLESRFDISGSWMLPHALYLCLSSFTGEDGERDGDREMKRCLLSQDLRSDRHATTDRTGHRPNHTEKPCVVPQLKPGPPVRPPPHRPDRSQRSDRYFNAGQTARLSRAQLPRETGPTALHAGLTDTYPKSPESNFSGP